MEAMTKDLWVFLETNEDGTPIENEDTEDEDMEDKEIVDEAGDGYVELE